MKHLFRRLLVAGAAVAMLSCGAALAAEEPAISVQLDGDALTFTDAIPQVKNERTFLPFRAIFEAMGAQVDWSKSDQTVTAKRDGISVTMTLDGTIATVEKDGTSTEITMDVAPYVDTETWRTYVPVRFAAQAFDCAVGWDQEASTVILVDTDKLLSDATGEQSFTYLEKYLTYSEKFNEGIWDTELTLDGSMAFMGVPISLSGSAAGTVADRTKMAIDMGMKLDMTAFMTALSSIDAEGTAYADLSPEDQAVLDALANEGIGIQMRGDLGAGTFYMNMNGSALQEIGISSDAWYSMDLAALYEEMGMDYSSLIQSSKSFDYKAIVKTVLQKAELTDAAADYSQLKSVLEYLASHLSDNAFQQQGDNYVTIMEYSQDGTQLYFTLGLTIKNDEVVGYSINIGLTAEGEDGSSSAMDILTSMNENNQMNAQITMDMAQLVTIDLSMTGGYTPGTAAPETEPPAGATVIPFADMAGM